MRALFDSEAHAVRIDLVDPPHEAASWADSNTYPILPHYDADDRLIAVEILYADTLSEEEVVTALTGLDLDIPTLLAAWRAGVAAPDREVVVGPAIPA
ncbi:MAG: hypothetical protein ACKOGE_01230 [Actinomycetota bacterium]